MADILQVNHRRPRQFRWIDRQLTDMTDEELRRRYRFSSENIDRLVGLLQHRLQQLLCVDVAVLTYGVRALASQTGVTKWDKMEVPGSVSLPLLGIGVFTLLLSMVFCCYMWKLKRDARKERGYRRIQFSPKKKQMRNDTCPVCLDEFLMKEKIAICTCHHVFHSRCLLEWLRHKNSCPMCKAPVRRESSNSRVVPVETTGLILAVPLPSTSNANAEV